MEIREVADKARTTIKKNPLLIIGGVGAVALFVMLRGRGGSPVAEEGEEIVAVNGSYSSYPDAVTNAESIISSMTENLNFAMEQLKEDYTAQLGAFDDKLQDLDDKREEDREYVTDALNDAKDLWSQNNEQMLDDIKQQLDSIKSEGSISGYQPGSYVTNNITYNQTTESQKPPAASLSVDINAAQNAVMAEREAKQVADRDKFLSQVSGAISSGTLHESRNPHATITQPAKPAATLSEVRANRAQSTLKRVIK